MSLCCRLGTAVRSFYHGLGVAMLDEFKEACLDNVKNTLLNQIYFIYLLDSVFLKQADRSTQLLKIALVGHPRMFADSYKNVLTEFRHEKVSVFNSIKNQHTHPQLCFF